MEDILTQRINYAVITSYKDYCRLDEKKHTGTTFNEDLEDLYSSAITLKELFGRGGKGIITELPEKMGNRKTKFFYDNSDVTERFTLNYAYKNKNNINGDAGSFVTTKDRHIKNHYANPFSSISVHTYERSIRLNGDKLTIKLYQHIKYRKLNDIYFKKSVTIDSFIFNMSTGNFTIITTNRIKGGKMVKRFSTNSFHMLIPIFKSEFVFDVENKLPSSLKHSLSNNEFTKKIYESFGVNNYGTPLCDRLPDVLMKKFVDTKKIKVSNDYEFMLANLYPTEKFLKKNERKLIASILDMFQIKTKVLVKLMHQNPKFDILSVAIICYVFGDNFSKYIGSIDPQWFHTCFLSNPPDCDKLQFAKIKKQVVSEYEFNDSDRENLVRIINSGGHNNKTLINGSFIGDLLDHFRMIKKLKPYDPTISMKARTIKEFSEEHSEFSKMISLIKKGWAVEYKFADKMVNDVEKPLDIQIDMTEYDESGNPIGNVVYDKFKFFPYILKREEDYTEEGTYMHHCVASYSDKEKSIIVSIRNDDASNRVTCEFDCQTGKLIQSRHFCNRIPPPEYELAVCEMEKKTLHYARFGILHALDKRKVPIKINGIELKIEDREPTRYGQYIGDHIVAPLPF